MPAPLTEGNTGLPAEGERSQWSGRHPRVLQGDGYLKLQNVTKSVYRAVLIAIVMATMTSAANAQQVVRADEAQPTAVQPTAMVVQPAAQPVYVAAVGDPYGFVNWLNTTRAQYGLSAVGYDPNLTNWAAMNNNHQSSRGMGHYVMGPARRQNSAMGAYANIGAMWMASPAHRAALLDPTIRFVGIAGAGAYWTYNAY